MQKVCVCLRKGVLRGSVIYVCVWIMVGKEEKRIERGGRGRKWEETERSKYTAKSIAQAFDPNTFMKV